MHIPLRSCATSRGTYCPYLDVRRLLLQLALPADALGDHGTKERGRDERQCEHAARVGARKEERLERDDREE